MTGLIASPDGSKLNLKTYIRNRLSFRVRQKCLLPPKNHSLTHVMDQNVSVRSFPELLGGSALNSLNVIKFKQKLAGSKHCENLVLGNISIWSPNIN